MVTNCHVLRTWMRPHFGWTCQGTSKWRGEELGLLLHRTTGHNKAHFTVILVKPVFKGVCIVPELTKVSGVVVSISQNSWMNEELAKDWVLQVRGQLNFSKRLFVWGCILQVSHHECSEATNTYVAIFQVDLLLLYSMQISHGINHSKRHIVNCLIGWPQERKLTAVRAPSKVTCLQWVKQPWLTVSEEMIHKSFMSCGS